MRKFKPVQCFAIPNIEIYHYAQNHKKNVFADALIYHSSIGNDRVCLFYRTKSTTWKRLTIETEKEVRPCKIVFFTDTHFGKYYSETHIEDIVNKINALNADFVIFGGDLLDNYARDRNAMDMEYLGDKLLEINAAVGKYAIWGNHDHGGGAARIYEDFMTSCGFELLNSESRLFADYGIQIFGFDDYLMG